MNKKEKAARNVLIGGCIASVIAGIVLWLTLSLSTGLIVAGAGLVASGLLASFLLKSASRGGKPEETKLVDRKVIEEAAKKVRKTSPKSMKKEMRDLTTQCERMLQKAELTRQNAQRTVWLFRNDQSPFCLQSSTASIRFMHKT